MDCNSCQKLDGENRYGTYTIIGEPIAWARASTNFEKRRIYDKQKHHKDIVAQQLILQHKNKPYFLGPLSLDVVFYMPMAKYMLKDKDKWLGKLHTNTPDSSNMIKLIEDVAKGILYADDKVIASGSFRKIYALPEDSRTVFTIMELQ